jgi:hypothetical protein
MTATRVPEWQALHTYAVPAVVSQSGRVLPLWRATTGGTSAAAEPTWPVASPWTVTDGTVTWTLNTTFRQDVHAGIVTTLGTFRTANPTLLRKVWHARPGSFTLGELPCAVLGSMTESITTMNGIRQRRMDGFTIEIVDRSPDNEEADDRMNALIDALMDYVTGAYHMASGTSIVEPIGVTDGDTGAISEGSNVFWYSNVIGFRAYVMEGRT